MHAEPERVAIARDLAREVEGEVRFGLHDRMLYATDASIYQIEPLGVVVPASPDDAVRVVRFCSRHGLAILPRGGGTSLAGQCTSRAVVIDLSVRCRGVLEVDAGARRCRVEAGVTLDDLNERLAHLGLMFAPDPATSRHATVGGCVGNNAAGARSVRYGRTSESLVGLDVCLPDGRRVTLARGAAGRDATVRELTEGVVDIVRRHERLIRERYPETVRRNAGYGLDMILAQLDAGGGDIGAVNLAHLLAGSEGTLAVTLAADLALVEAPRARGLAVVPFATLDGAIEAVGAILGTSPSAVELLDDTVIGLALGNAEHRAAAESLPRIGGETPAAVLYVEYGSARDSFEVSESFEALRKALPGRAVRTHTDGDEMTRAWALRKAGEPLLHGVEGARKPISFVEDNAVPPERLGEFVREFRALVEAQGTKAAFYAHASVGVLHVRPMLDLHDGDDEQRMHTIAVETARLAKRLGGVMSGEHGDGRVRSPMLTEFYGPELMDAFREIKALFDPRNLLNPGNIVEPEPVPSISRRTRVRPADAVLPEPVAETFFDYTGGLGHEVERCNGAGVCRKPAGGTMCPSYMATLDERHSTRGRGNALRLAITGQLRLAGRGDGPDWLDPETLRTLDLCLGCKACKSECPSNVDIARLKSEYLAQRHRELGGAPLATRLLTSVRGVGRAAAVAPWAANAVARFTPTRWVLNRALGLAPARSLPRYERSLARRWVPESGGGPRVALFADCFCSFNKPSVALAARRVLGAFGYRVELVVGGKHGCCGRPKISNGLLPEAIREADRTIAQLRPLIEDEDALALIVLEPSCLSAITDDWQRLTMTASGELRAAAAAKACSLETFLERRWDEHPRRPEVSEPPGRVLLHGHCHEKAVGEPGDSAALLRRLCGEKVEVLDAGCCGMAGAWGMSPGRFELSMRIGERVLLPAVRSALRDGATVVAAGTSCRQQILDGARVRALHPVELMQKLVCGPE